MTRISTAAVALLQEARRRIKANTELSPKKRNDWRASINAIIAKAEPAGLVGSPLTLEAEIDRFLTDMLKGATRSDKANISRTRAALIDLGYNIQNGWGRKALVGAWAVARSKVAPETWNRLMTLPEWAEAAGIDPPQINGRHLTDYSEFRSAKSRGQKGERQRFLALVDTWPVICKILEIPVPNDLPVRASEAYRYCYSEMSWDPALRADVERAAQLLVAKSAPWRVPPPSRLSEYRDALYRFASAYCRSTGTDHSGLKTLEPLLTVAGVEGVGVYLADRCGRFRPAERAAAPYAALCLACLLADHCYDIHDKIRAALKDLRCDLAPPLSLELSSNRQAKLQQFEKPEAVKLLFEKSLLKLAEFSRAPEVDPHMLAQGCAALGLHLGLTFALHPYMLARCVVRRECDPSTVAVAEIVESGTCIVIRIARSTRSSERVFELTGDTLELYRRFRARTAVVPGCSPDTLLPAPAGGMRSPVAVGRSITALMATAMLEERVTATDMPAISAIAVMKHPSGTRELARRHLGRNWQAQDPLFDTIERWQRNAVRDDALFDGR